MINSRTCSFKQPLKILYHSEITFATPSQLELNMSQKQPLGVEIATTQVSFIIKSNPWARKI